MADNFPQYPATSFDQAVDLTIYSSNQLGDVINGDATSVVSTESGDIPTLRKALVDNFYFKNPIQWNPGNTNTVFNQLYVYDTDNINKGWYYAPTATATNPILMGDTPVGDANWKLYSLVTTGIPAQVFPWSTEITQLTSSIVPPYEFDTAIVTYNSAVLVPGKDYTIANNTLTFTPPLKPEPDAEVADVLFCYIGKVQEGNPSTNYVTYTSLGASTAAALIGTSSGQNVQQVLNQVSQQGKQVFPVTSYGAVTNGSTSDASATAYAFQKACMAARDAGGGKVVVPTGTYYLNYPVYLFSNTSLDLCGSKIIFIDPTFNKGRGGFVIGSSYEANRDKAIANYQAGTFPGASTINTSYVNLTLNNFLRDNQSYVESTNCHIYNGTITAMFTSPTGWGGYGVNFVNAQHSSAHDLFFEGWTQAIGMGSDTTPETPSNYDCHAYNLRVTYGDLVRTYYAIGFISNSSECSLSDCFLMRPLTAGTANGSAVSLNVTENCIIEGIVVKNLGLTASSEVVLINNSRGTVVKQIHGGNCKSVVSTYYQDVNYISASNPNVISDVTGNATVSLIQIRSKYDIFSNFAKDDATPYDILLANTNASNNIIKSEPKALGVNESSTVKLRTYLQNNSITGWKRKYKYLRPADILTSDKASTTTWSYNKLVSTLSGVDLHFMWEIPDNFKAVDTITLFCRFNNAGDAAFTAGSTVFAELIQMIAFDGNINTAPYSCFSNSRVAPTGVSDTTLTAGFDASVSPGLVLMSDTTHGLENSFYVHLAMTLNVPNNYMKEVRISYWG